MSDEQNERHAATGVYLGFWYQSLYALRTLVSQSTDNAAVGIEQLDDIELHADGQTLLYQLKHSIQKDPPRITMRSSSVWRTIKVWIDALPSLTLAETTFHLVTVSTIGTEDPLHVLTGKSADRSNLASAMSAEAQRVLAARKAAGDAGQPRPYSDRVDGCQAFISLSDTDRLNLLRRVLVMPGSPDISKLETEIAEHLLILPANQRTPVVGRLVEWWDRQVLYSLCGVRERIITRSELQAQVSTIISDIERDELIPNFEIVSRPEDYQPDGMLARQIQLVKGRPSDFEKAIREEWRAREQRARWVQDNPAMASTINDYDLVLHEYWSDRHARLIEDCSELQDDEKCASGLNLLRWTHDDAPKTVRPIADGWGAAYYVRGSYQVLAINLKVGWHPDYQKLLEVPE